MPQKTPPWTTLGATANINDAYIVVNGSTNWVVGDHLVITSSSLYAGERKGRAGLRLVTCDRMCDLVGTLTLRKGGPLLEGSPVG